VTGWSRWVFVVEPKRPLGRRTVAEIKANAARYARIAMGDDVRVQITTYADGTLTLVVRAQGHSVLDPRYVERITECWAAWAVWGWGDGTRVRCAVATVCEAPVELAKAES